MGPARRLCLVQQGEVIAAVFLPAIFVGLSALRLLFTVTDGLERVRAHAALEQRLLGGVGTVFTQRQVELSGTTFITIAFNLDFPALLLDQLCSLGQGLLCVR